MTSRYVDGEFGPRTMEAAHLFGKSDEYQDGYRLGKGTGNEGRLKERESYAARRGDDFLRGFLFGQQVHHQGIKQALRKGEHMTGQSPVLRDSDVVHVVAKRFTKIAENMERFNYSTAQQDLESVMEILLWLSKEIERRTDKEQPDAS